MTLAALALWLTHSFVDVRGDSVCPAPAEVQRRVAELTGPGWQRPAAVGGPRFAYLSRIGGTLRVELLRADGARIGERELAAQGSCDDLAAALAVTITSWEAELETGVASRIALPAPPPRPPLPAEVARRAAPETDRPPSEPRPSFLLGLGMAAAVAGGAAVPAFELEAAAAPAGQRFGLGAGLSIASSRTAAVGAIADAARWTRTALTLGPQFRAGSAPLMVDLRAGPVAALLHVEGVGLLRPQSDISLQVGGAAAVRARWSWGTAAPWLGVEVLAFPGRDLLEVGGDAQRGQLPRIELQIGGGLSLGRFP